MKFLTDTKGEYDEFIKNAMREYDSTVYTEAEFDLLRTTEHENILYLDKSFNILTFCTIIVMADHYKMCYSWCDGSRESIKAYAKGIDYVVARCNPLAFGVGAIKFNKIKRLLTWTDKP